MKRKHISLSTTCLLIMACFNVNAAQNNETEENNPRQLEDVEVTATKKHQLPRYAGRITKQNLQRQRAATADTASMLTTIPGVALSPTGGTSSLPVIRGMADDRIRIKVDGMDLLSSCPNHMNPALSYLAPSQVGELRVFAGITPVSLGGDSIGGTIIANTSTPIFSLSPDETLLTGEIGSYYRSNGNAWGMNFSSTYATENFNITYRGNWSASDNYQAGNDFKNFYETGNPGHYLNLDEVGSTAYRTRNHNLDMAWKNENDLYELKLGHQNIPYQLYPNQRMDMLGNTEDRLNLRYLSQRDWGQLEIRAYREWVDHFMDFGADKQFIYGMAPGVVAPGMPMYAKSMTSGFALNSKWELHTTSLLRTGLELQTYKLNDWWPPSPHDLTGMLDSYGKQATFGGMAPNTFWNINNGKRDRFGVYAELDKTWNEQWSSQTGIRYEHVISDTGPVQGYHNQPNVIGYYVSAQDFNKLDRKRNDDNIDLTLLTRYQLDDQRSLEFGYARKTRSPNLYERYSWSRSSMALVMNNFVGDGNGYLGNPNLKPEIANVFSVSATWKNSDKDQELIITPYLSHINDYIDAIQWDPIKNQATQTPPGQFGILKYVNQTARIYGVDLAWKTELVKSTKHILKADGILSYTRGRNRDTDSGLFNIMPLNAKINITHFYDNWENSLQWIGVKSKTNTAHARQELATPGYSLWNWHSSYQWGSLRIDVGIDNLFNKHYFLPLGGTYTGQGKTMSINAIPFGISVPGQGRSLYAGINYTF